LRWGEGAKGLKIEAAYGRVRKKRSDLEELENTKSHDTNFMSGRKKLSPRAERGWKYGHSLLEGEKCSKKRANFEALAGRG